MSTINAITLHHQSPSNSNTHHSLIGVAQQLKSILEASGETLAQYVDSVAGYAMTILTMGGRSGYQNRDMPGSDQRGSGGDIRKYPEGGSSHNGGGRKGRGGNTGKKGDGKLLGTWRR